MPDVTNAKNVKYKCEMKHPEGKSQEYDGTYIMTSVSRGDFAFLQKLWRNLRQIRQTFQFL